MRHLCVVFLLVCLPASAADLTLADLEKACAKGDGQSCVDYGFNLEQGDPAKAVAVYRAACNKNQLAACSNLALMLRDARGAKRDLDEAAKVAKKACDGNNAPGCLHLGLVKDAANDFPAASAAYEVACKKSIFQGCTNFAINLHKGVGVKRDGARAIKLLEQACGESVKKTTTWPSLRSCLVLGQLYEQGLGVARNKDSAKRLYKLACLGGLDEGCDRLGRGPTNINDHDDGHGH